MDMQMIQQVMLAPAAQPDPVENMRKLAEAQLAKIGKELQAVGVFQNLPPMDIRSVSFWPAYVHITLASGAKAEVDAQIALRFDQEPSAGSFLIDGVLVRIEEPNEL